MSGKKNRFDKSFRQHWKSQDMRDVPQGAEDRIWNRVNQMISAQSSKSKLYILPRLLKYAAIFVGVLSLSIGAYQWFGVAKTIDALEHENVVVIESEDGAVRKILEGVDANFAMEQVASVNYDTNKIVYQSDLETQTDAVVRYHTLKVPYGKMFELVLSDGSRVYINSGSSIRYPVKFIKGAVRAVTLTGEAYFEVTKNESPFIVKTAYLKTEVFGTQFNVSAYESSHQTEVVLVEGSVGVFTQGDRFEDDRDLRLHPNEMVSSKNPNKAYEIDVRDYISWKEGEMVFKNETFENIATKLERHFKITIVIDRKDLLKERFTGKFMNDEIEGILDTFKEVIPFDYKKIDNKIIIR